MKLELNHKRKVGKNSNTWTLKSILLKNEWVNQEIKEEIKKYMETNENDNMTVQDLWDAAKVVRGKFIAIQAYLKKQEKNFFKDFIYLFDRESEHKQGELQRERGRSRLPAEQGARCGTRSQDPGIMT